MTGQVGGEEKNRRIQRLLAEGKKAERAYFAGCAKRGEIRTVLFEEVEEGLLTGYSENYIKVYAAGGEELLNSFQKVRLLEEYKDGMKGELIHG